MCSYDSILSLPTSKATLLRFFDVASIYTGHSHKVTLEYLRFDAPTGNIIP